VATGLSNPQIAQKLNISPKTVRNHINHIFSKLNLRDRALAIVQAREAGLGLRKAGSRA
jgi:DNA-binding NarL/FixJ family response regulator